jgi:hypothetical protein
VNTVPVVGYLARIELRRSWRALVLLSLLTAVTVAISLSSVAGARRSETAFDRYLEYVRSPEAAAFGELGSIESLADHEAVAELIWMDLVAAMPTAGPSEDFFPLITDPTGALGYERLRFPVVDGRRPDPTKPLEVALSERTSRRLGLGIGDRMEALTMSGPTALAMRETGEGEPDGPTITFDVVGIVRDPGDIGARANDITITLLSPAFRTAYSEDEIGAISDPGAFVVLRDGHTLRDVAQELGPDAELDVSFSAEAFRTQAQPTMSAIATALRVFAAVVAVAGLIAVVQAAVRLQGTARADDEALGALGAGRGGRWARLVLPSLLAVAAGVGLGVLGAIALSSRFPIGLARRAEPEHGIRVDAPTLLLGSAGGLIMLAVLLGLASGWSLRRSRRPGARPSPLVRLATRAGAPPTAVTGLTLAGGPSGGRSGIAIGGTVFGVLGVLAALVFAASIDRLRSDPALYGWGWDAIVEADDLSSLRGTADDVRPRLVADPDVSAVGDHFTQIPVTLDGEPEYAGALLPVDGTFTTVVVDGKEPVRPNELAVGQDTMDRIGADVGDDVEVGLGETTRTMRITAVVSMFVPLDGGSLASGVLLSPATFSYDRLLELCEDTDSCSNALAVSLRDGVDPHEFAERYEDPELETAVQLPSPPSDIDRLTAVEDLPGYLALFLAGLGAVAISFATATTVRERRRDLAVLRVLGMTGGHVRRVVSVLVLAVSLAGAVVGLGLGFVVGRLVWRAVAESVAIPFAPSVPALAGLLVAVSAIVLGQVVALQSRQAAARVPTAAVLRAE